MDVLIFKTSLIDRQHVHVANKLLRNLEGIIKWNVDVEDIDHVLRLEVDNIQPKQIESTLNQAGYYCVEMED